MTYQTNSDQPAGSGAQQASAQQEPKKHPSWKVVNGRHLTVRNCKGFPQLAGRGVVYIVESGDVTICSGAAAIAYPGSRVKARSGSTILAYEGVEIVTAHKNAAVMRISQHEPRVYPKLQMLNGRISPTDHSIGFPQLRGLGITFVVMAGEATICSGVTAIAYPVSKIKAHSGSTIIAYERAEIVKAHKNAVVIRISTNF